MLTRRFTKVVMTIGLFAVGAFTSISANPSPNENQHQEMRIVSAGGSVTEILFALGLEDAIIATDTSSSFPQKANRLPKVGYYRQLSTEGVLSLQPSHIFAAKGAGPQDVLKQIEDIGIQTHIFEQTRSVKGLKQLIFDIAEKTNTHKKAQALIDELSDELAQLHKPHLSISPVFLMSANERGLMAAGSNTVPSLLMKLLGFNNLFDEFQGFKPISVEALLASNAQLIFIPAHQTQGLSTAELCQTPPLRLWSKLNGCNIEIVDSLMFLGMTPRLPSAAKHMLQRIESAQQRLAQVAN